MGAELVQGDLPLMGNHRRQRKPVPCQADGRLQQFGKRQLAKTLRQLGPCRRAARHRHRGPAIQRHLFMAGGLHRLNRHRRRRMPVAVKAMQLALAPDQRKSVAPQAAAGGFDHRQRRRRGDGGINGVAAFLHDLDTSLGSQRLGSRDHAAPGEHALALGRIRVFMSREFQHGKGSSKQGFIGRI